MAHDNPDKLTLPVALTPLTALIVIRDLLPCHCLRLLTATKVIEFIEKSELVTTEEISLAHDNPDKLTLPVALTPLTALNETVIAHLQRARSRRECRVKVSKPKLPL